MQQGKREKVNVLFVCTGNTCRSPMAEQIFSEYLRRNKCASMADVSGAGVFADNNRPMQPEAVGVLSEMNMTVRPHKSRRVTVDILQNADIIVCMSEENRTELMYSSAYGYAASDGNFRIVGTAGELIGEDIPDPYGRGMDAYRRAAELITKLCAPLEAAVRKFQNEHKLEL